MTSKRCSYSLFCVIDPGHGVGQDIVEAPVWNVADKWTISDDTVGQAGTRLKEGRAWYWYPPDAKYIVKCQYERTDYWDTINDWEVISFKLKP